MPYDIYETRRLIQALEGINPADSFLRDRYFPTNGTADIFNHEKVLCEYMDGDMRLAPVVVDHSGGVTMSRPGATMYEYAPPEIHPKRPLTLDEVTVRGFGEALYGELSPQQRAQIMAMRDLEALSNAITRTEEKMAADTLLNNACTLTARSGDGSVVGEHEVRFYNETTNPASYTVTAKWDTSTADILGDLDQMASMLTRKGLPATDYVCAPDVARVIINNDEIQKLLDIRRFDMGNVAPVLQAAGASLVCQLNVMGRMINVISYDQVYTDPSTGAVTQYIPSGCGVMTAPGAGHTVYGAVTQVEQSDGQMHTYAKSRVPKYIANASSNTRELEVTARPLCLPYQRNAFIAAKSLLTA